MQPTCSQHQHCWLQISQSLAFISHPLSVFWKDCYQHPKIWRTQSFGFTPFCFCCFTLFSLDQMGREVSWIPYLAPAVVLRCMSCSSFHLSQSIRGTLILANASLQHWSCSQFWCERFLLGVDNPSVGHTLPCNCLLILLCCSGRCICFCLFWQFTILMMQSKQGCGLCSLHCFSASNEHRSDKQHLHFTSFYDFHSVSLCICLCTWVCVTGRIS